MRVGYHRGMQIDRRQFVHALPAVSGIPLLSNGSASVPAPAQSVDWPPMPTPRDAVTEVFPTHEPALVKLIVGRSHSSLAEVRALVGAYPSLAKAAWDWGFGDWETALGAASHVGQRAIAEFLLEHGAPPTIFSAAMLGQLDVVKAFGGAGVSLTSITGPHGIPLIAHARAGGPNAAAVVAYLDTLGPLPAVPSTLAAAERAALVGQYRFGPGPRDLLTVEEQGESLRMTRSGATPLRLMPVGERAFHPAGAPRVRIVFGPGMPSPEVSVTDGPRIARGRR